MIYLNPEVRSGLGEDTFWTWFNREFNHSTFSEPSDVKNGDVILQYSTKGPSPAPGFTLALMWELYPEMKVALNSNEYDGVIAHINRTGMYAKRLTVSSELVIPFYSRLGKPIDVLPIGVNTDLFRPRDRGEMREKYGIGRDRRVGIWCGTHHTMKGFHLLQEYRKSNPDVEWIVSWTYPSQNEALDWAHTFCSVPQLQLSELMSAADFFLCTSLLRPYYMVEWEAMANSVPFVIIGNQEREFIPSLSPRSDVFERGWDRFAARQKWAEYLLEHYNAS